MIRAALSGPLLAMTAYKQFVIYRVEPDLSRPGKTNKYPVNTATGLCPADAQDSSIWLDADTAVRIAEAWGEPYGVGFVFTANDPFFFFDADGALQGGAWTPTALDMCSRFAGCAIEVSNSLTGLHVFGMYSGAEPEHKKKNAGYGLELYTSKRFAALTGTSALGNVATDATAVLAQVIEQYFKPDELLVAREYTGGPVADWHGPTDDDELLRRFLEARPTAAQSFNGEATNRQLWEAEESAMLVSFADGAGGWDSSKADMGLAQRLAFWTGCDVERIETLMRRSALMRDKWDDRHDYLQGTIAKACARQVEVYQDREITSQRRQEQIAENIRIGEGSDEHRTVEVMTLDQMLSRYLYLTDMESVQDLNKPRRIFSLSAFMKAHCSSKTEQVVEGEWGPDGQPKVKVYPTSKLWMDSDQLRVAPMVTFRAGAPVLTEDPDGNESANTWRPIDRKATSSSVEVFTAHIDYLFGADAPRFLDWLAHIEQNPGVLPHSGWVHVSPMQGTGRNWLASVLCRLWRGFVAPNFDLAGTLNSGFNGRLSHKLLAVVDEIDEGGSDAKWENSQALKSLVTTDTRAINPKYGHQRLEWNACRWLIFSNHTSALPLTEKDRRFNVVHNERAPMPEGYYGKLYATLKDASFIEAVAWMLKTRNISGFNPGAHAVMSEAKRDMIGASKSDADDIIAYLVAEHPADVITNTRLAEILSNQQYSTLSAHHRHALDRAGTKAYGKAVRVEGKVMKVRILRNYDTWKDASYPQIVEELRKANAPQR